MDRPLFLIRLAVKTFIGRRRMDTYKSTPSSNAASEQHLTPSHTSLNLNDEYAKAFRTQSYGEFWSKVQHYNMDRAKEGTGSQQTPSASPPTCGPNALLAENLLEPNQEAVETLLECGIFSEFPELYSLVTDYFSNSAEASKLCGLLLENIDRAKTSYRNIQNVFDITPATGDFTTEQCHLTMKGLLLFIEVDNPFSDPTSQHFQNIHECYASLMERLDRSREKVLRKLKLVTGCKKASAVLVIAACTALAICAVVLASHVFIAFVAGPAVVSFPPSFVKRRIESLRLLGTAVLARHMAQLDAATKGAYILNRDFDTISRLVTRLHDEVEHNKVMINFCLQRKHDRHPLQEVVKHLRRNHANFSQQLEELEEHAYLCFMTINRARNLVFEEIHLAEQAMEVPQGQR